MPPSDDQRIETTALLDQDMDSLYRQLGDQLTDSGSNRAVRSFMQAEGLSQSEFLGFDDPIDLARRFARRYNRDAWELVCGEVKQGNDLQKQFRDALDKGMDAAAVALVGILSSKLGLSSPLAKLLAVIFVKQFLKSTYDATCSYWKSKLPPPELS